MRRRNHRWSNRRLSWGPVGMTAGVIGGAIAGQCTKDSFSDRGSKDKSNNYNGPGQCRW